MVKSLTTIFGCIIFILFVPVALVQADRVVTVAYHETKPLSFTGPDGSARGIYPEIMQEIARRAAWTLNWEKVSWVTGLEKVASGRVDFLGPIAFIKARLERFNFNNETIIVDWGQVYLPRDSEIHSLLDLAGKRIAVQRGHIILKNLNILLNQFDIACQIVATEDQRTAFELVRSGKVDGGAVNRLFGLLNEREYGVQRSPIIYYPMELRFAAPKNGSAELLSTLDRYLRELKAEQNSVYHRALDRWLLGQSGSRFFLSSQQLLTIAASVAGLVLFLFILTFVFKKQVNARTRDLSQSEARLRQIAEHIEAVFWIVSPDWEKLYYISPAYETIWERSCESLRQQPLSWLNSVLEPDRAKVLAYIESKKQGAWDEIVFPEYRIQNNHGDVRWISARGQAIRDHKGEVHQVTGIAQDITRRVRSQQAIQDSRKQLITILEASPDPIVMYNTQGHPQYLSPAFTRVFGWTLKELEGNPIPYVPPHDRDTNAALVRELAEKGQPIRTETQRLTKDGGLRDVIISAASITDSLGNWIGNVANLTDITDNKRLEAQLQQSQKMDAIGTLAGGIAHDFNNILGIIIGNTELALDDVPEWNPAKQNIEEIKTAGLRAKGVVRQLLSFSRKTKQVKKPIRLTPIIEESLKLLRASIPSTIEIDISLPEQIPTVEADPTQIHQVLLNLCTNAADAMEETGGRLEVSLQTIELDRGISSQYHDLMPGRYLLLMVSDTGSGMDTVTIKRIFDPYFTTKAVGKGTGMGLAIVHGIVKNHGGAVTVHSEPGRGTAIKILFPAITAEVAATNEQPQPIPTGSESILFIDDEPAAVRIGRQMLVRLGYQVQGFTNPTTALEIFKERPAEFDLIITDMTMPTLTGDILAKEARIIRSDVPIIICTGFSEKMDATIAAEMGIDHYIEKPLDKQQLAYTIREVLDMGPTL